MRGMTQSLVAGERLFKHLAGVFITKVAILFIAIVRILRVLYAALHRSTHANAQKNLTQYN